VKWIDKVLEVALERQPTPLPEDEAAAAAPIAPAAKGAQPGTTPASVKH
jgi:ATP-dependent Lon protease